MNSDDRRLINSCLAGRVSGFNDLVRKYQDRLYNSVLRIVNNPEDAADVVQESFINAYQSLKSFKGDSEFFTWLYRIAFNAAVSLKRKKKPQYSLELPNGELCHHPTDESIGSRPDYGLIEAERDKELYRAMALLSEDHRQVLILRDLDDMSYEDIAEIIAVPIGTVRSRLNRARLELRERLQTADVSQEDSRERRS